MERMRIADEVNELLDMIRQQQLTAYRVHTDTGVGYATLNGLISGDRQVGRLSIDVAQTLIDYKNKING